MLIDFKKAVAQFGLQIKGIVQVGAHWGEEYDTYRELGITDVVMIEPAKPAFEILQHKFGGNNNVKLFPYAMGSKTGMVNMHVETKNNGQSNSLLQPLLHLQQFPDITFDKMERVELRTLDSLFMSREKYNTLVMDCQGYEHEVLKGGESLLDGIDYVYTEVNRDQVYKDCAQIGEIDELLGDFDRVMTDWGGVTWGDALYVRRKEDVWNKKGIEYVPREFRPKMPFKYPDDNEVEFERWYFENFTGLDYNERTYLPVFWCGYHVKNSYGKNARAISRLQGFIDRLDYNKKYYTIVQYDDGTLVNMAHLDIKVFSMSGQPPGSIPIPLLCQPHGYVFDVERDIFASFVGRVTHPIRQHIIDAWKGKPGYYISTATHTLHDYCKILARSKFVLCPRGYGANSFRIQEALQYGAIPVYISDVFTCNTDFDMFGVMMKDGVQMLDKILQETKKKIILPDSAYRHVFSYMATKRYILQKL